MKYKGIEKGDQKFRHFTFDDQDYIQKNGVYYYRVNYGKSKLEGADAEDEIGYVACNKVMPIGGKGPATIPGQEKKEETPEQKVTAVRLDPPPSAVEKPKRGRPPKVKVAEPSNETIPVAQGGVQKFEYYVTNLLFGKSEELQNMLNEMGNEGWELCGFESNKTLFSNPNIIAVFKRKRG